MGLSDARAGVGRKQPKTYHVGAGTPVLSRPRGETVPRHTLLTVQVPLKVVQAFSCFTCTQNIKIGRAGMSRKFLKRAKVP